MDHNANGNDPIANYNFHFNHPVDVAQMVEILDQIGQFADKQNSTTPVCQASPLRNIPVPTYQDIDKPIGDGMYGVGIDLKDESVYARGQVQFEHFDLGPGLPSIRALTIGGEDVEPTSDIVVIGDKVGPYGILIPFANTTAIHAALSNNNIGQTITAAIASRI